MRGSSRIASLLGIAPRTAETHTFNVMRKMNCKSREGILDFVETSGKCTLFREHYYNLSARSSFERSLKDVFSLIRHKALTCCLFLRSSQEAEKMLSMTYSLEEHLKLAGFQVTIERKDQVDSLQPKFSHPKLWEGWGEEIIGCLLCDLSPEPFFVSSQEDYYLVLFEFLQKTLAPLKLEESIVTMRKAFQKQLKNAVENPLEKNSLLFSKESFFEENPSQRKRWKDADWLIKSLKYISLAVGILFLGVFCFEFIGQRGHKIEKNDDIRIRSDLPIPAEDIVLKRSSLLTQIDSLLKKKGEIQILALVGIGGAGKTILARQYAHSYVTHQSIPIIWEVNAETKESLQESFENLAYALSRTPEDKATLRKLKEIKDNKEKETKILFFVKGKLRFYSHWFFIYDNVTKIEDILAYFPCDPDGWGKGRAIVTTQDENIGTNNFIHNAIAVEELTPPEKSSLFISIMGRSPLPRLMRFKTRETDEFLKHIASFPLDISIAAYHLKATDMSFEGYLQNLTRYSQEFQAMQEGVLKEATSYARTRYCIIAFALSRLIGAHKDFTDLLMVISFLDSQNIPKDLLELFTSKTAVGNFVYQLKKHSLLLNSPFSPPLLTISIHPCTQEVSLNYLTTLLKIESNQQILLPFLTTFMSYIKRAREGDDFRRLGLLVRHCERLIGLNQLLGKALLSPESLGCLKGELGAIYAHLSDFAKAKKSLEESLSLFPAVSSSIRPEAKAQALVYLGYVHRMQGDDQKALDLLESSLPKEGFSPSFKAWRATHLASIYRRLGEYKKAQSLFEESLFFYRKYSPNAYSKIAFDLIHLGDVYRLLGESQKAKIFVEEGLALYRKHSPQNVSKISWALVQLGKIFEERGEYLNAKNLFEEALHFHKEAFSENHPGIAWVTVCLGRVYGFLEDASKARVFLEKGLALYKKYFPENGLKISWALLSLGRVYGELEEGAKAEALLKEAQQILEKEKNNLETGRLLRELGAIYLQKDNARQARILFDKALKKLQNSTMERILCFESLAEASLKEGEKKDSYALAKVEALHFLKQGLSIAEVSFSEGSPVYRRLKKKFENLSQRAD